MTSHQKNNGMVFRRLIIATIMIGSFTNGCGGVEATPPSAAVSVVTAKNGVPIRVPPLQRIAPQHQTLPLIAWQWAGAHGLSHHQAVHDAMPWHQVTFATTAPIVLQWLAQSAPNTVNVTIFRQLPKPGERILPQNIVQACMVNATYSQSGGCTLGSHNTIRIQLTRTAQQYAAGMLISGLWVPSHYVKTAHILDHQAEWIARLTPFSPRSR